MRIDHTTVREGGPRPEGGATSLRWWTKDGEDAAQSITATLDSMRSDQSARLKQHLISARLYGNLSVLGMRHLATKKATDPAVLGRLSYNAVQSALDTVTSKIGKNKPKPLFLTSGGDYKLQRRARKLNQFVEGVFYENQAYKLGVESFRDGGVFGDGVVHVFPHNGRVKFERVSSSELWADELEGMYGDPRQMHRTKRVDRAVLQDLIATWARALKWKDAETKKKLEHVGGAHPVQHEPTIGDQVSDLIEVRESWHLPDGPDADEQDPKGGRHVISVDGCVLFSEPYLKPFFPFARFRWAPRLFGFWSQGGAEQVQHLQLEINKLLWVIQRSFHLAGSYKILLPAGSKVVKEHLNNDIGALIQYSGNVPPQYVVPQIVPPEIFQHLLTLKAAVYEQLGISMLSSTSQKPAGLNSGKALREYNDIESDRFMTIGQEYERFFVDLAKIAISVVKDIAGARGSYVVRAPTRRQILEIDWKDVRLEDDSYVLQAFPVSSLPNEPAGRQQTIQEWVQAGWISPRQGRRLMDFPDLEMAEGLANAAEDYLTEILERMVDDGEYTPPEPFDDLKLGYELALEYYARGKTQGLEEERLELLRRFLGQIDHLMRSTEAANQPQAPGAAPGAPGAGVPQAVPAGPPQSDLVPFAAA